MLKYSINTLVYFKRTPKRDWGCTDSDLEVLKELLARRESSHGLHLLNKAENVLSFLRLTLRRKANLCHIN